MNDLTRDSDRLIQQGRMLRDDNRAGGRHRRAPSIGEGSARLKQKNLWLRVRNIVLAVFAIWLGAGIAGALFSGIGFWGVMGVVVATAIAVALFSSFPKVKTPKRADINKGNVQQMVGRTELWLEAQRPALPPPAAKIIGDMGVQLDALGLQLEGVDQGHPKAREVRSLVGEQLPEMIDSYRRIPAHLRTEQRAGITPDEQLTDSLSKISGEIDSITRQLAEGSLDDLAIKHRYLDYKFGTGAETSPQLEDKS
ncbi:hypothetical protein P8Q88_05715 [Qipengyuania sp. XHP0207]|uniref:hypothetical protein n=1 Tax=Qipengyuania sp. XHP0207 TaxID=3038078 RepID=UPI00241C5ADC|nr:hypothetical protein [Qipengyuania sp. XHP0207]MDG5747671.1 hypothetical protein [Qipengyuania sp. XHP0207]